MENTNRQKHVNRTQSSQTALYKRIAMMQRRLTSLMNEKDTWEAKNKQLSDSLKTEKLLSASLKKENFQLQRMNHECAVEINSFKVKSCEVAQEIAACLATQDSLFPSLVSFSSGVTQNKLRLTNLLNRLPYTDKQLLRHPNQFQSETLEVENRRNEPMKQNTVGPMVKGCRVFTKPKIMLERLSLPQQRNQEVNVPDAEENLQDTLPSVNILSPIQEESEATMRNISFRSKRSRLGTRSLKKQEQLIQDQERERLRIASHHNNNEDSSETESLPTTVSRPEESQIVQPSQQVETDTREQESCRRTANNCIPINDPLEGSSWMYNSRSSAPSHKRQSHIALYKSDSSSDESTVAQPYINSSSSSVSLGVNNKTLNSPRRSTSIVHKSSIVNTLNDVDMEEPYSTINHFERTELSTDYGSLDTTVANEHNSLEYRKTLGLRPSTIYVTSTPNDSKPSEESVIEQEMARESIGKRKRKPVNFKYPSEEYVVPSVKGNGTPRFSTGRTNLLKRRRSTEKKLKRRSSSGSASGSEDTAKTTDKETKKTVGRPKNVKTKKPSASNTRSSSGSASGSVDTSKTTDKETKKTVERQKNVKTKKPSASNTRKAAKNPSQSSAVSEVEASVTIPDKTTTTFKARKSSILRKKSEQSFTTPSTSPCPEPQGSAEPISNRPRRNKSGGKSYKLPSLLLKQRRS